MVVGMLQGALLQASNDDAGAAVLAAMAGMWLVLMLVGLVVLAFAIYCWWRICAKTGFGGPWAFLLLVPGFGPIILILLLAFGDWPALRNRPS
jgi:energy-converting hydrogenase Eha subunit B